ncbi:IS66 family insertion sequence element accessory protein TnpB [Burkholderia ubonensis]|uniref:IS66 family insertion sequence element accessory protein TnpB n=1 Tax=Burkholderia ubonensis TaxID=101571 RepID=UPI0007C6C975|nr:IS66 family insertion sequence element accessory protein TnpB [Burkholderia ubonensis]
MIRVEAIWLVTESIYARRRRYDPGPGGKVFGAARPHHAYLVTYRHSTRLKELVYEGFGIWLAVRCLNKGWFVWTNGEQAIATGLNPEQLRALVTGLPWQMLTHDHTITVVQYPQGRKLVCFRGGPGSGRLTA